MSWGRTLFGLVRFGELNPGTGSTLSKIWLQQVRNAGHTTSVVASAQALSCLISLTEKWWELTVCGCVDTSWAFHSLCGDRAYLRITLKRFPTWQHMLGAFSLDVLDCACFSVWQVQEGVSHGVNGVFFTFFCVQKVRALVLFVCVSTVGHSVSRSLQRVSERCSCLTRLSFFRLLLSKVNAYVSLSHQL